LSIKIIFKNIEKNFLNYRGQFFQFVLLTGKYILLLTIEKITQDLKFTNLRQIFQPFTIRLHSRDPSSQSLFEVMNICSQSDKINFVLIITVLVINR
jgi:hypothetical protein